MLKHLWIIAGLSLLFGCVHNKVMMKQSISPSVITISRNSLSYDNIVICGNFNVNLFTGYKKSRIVVHGDRRDLQKLKTVVRGNTLFIIENSRTYPNYGYVVLDLYPRHLTSLNYKGTGAVIGNNLYSNYLNLSINNSGKTQLNGQMNVHQLTINGNGIFSLYWIKSHNLIIREFGNATVLLAGIADQLDVELWQNSRFNGRYLRAKQVFVKTHDHAIAGVNAMSAQHTLASDASDIYFYNLPNTRADFMAYNGSVLDMRDWQLFNNQEYTQYNK